MQIANEATLSIAPRNFYTDLDPVMRIHPVSEDLTMNRDLIAIRKSIYNLLMTNRYERPFENNGAAGGVHALLFESIDAPFFAHLTSFKIEQIIKEFEPRATNVKVRVSASDSNKNAININVSYSVRYMSIKDEFDLVVQMSR